MSVHLSRPPDEELRRHLEDQATRELSYPEVGATRQPERLLGRGIRVRYRLSHGRVLLGRGTACFERARRALRGWRHLQLAAAPGLESFELLWPDAPVEPGRCVGVGLRSAGLWHFQPCRIVYVDEVREGPVHADVFAYGTLPDHVLRGEERFAVEHHPGNDTVWYDVLAFSRPRRLALGLAGPWLRRIQDRFAAASTAAMARAVGEA